MLKKRIKIAVSLLIAAVLAIMSFNALIKITFAYFADKRSATSSFHMEVMDWFGVLDGKTADSTWGKAENPYLIYEQKHIKNLYVLQNTKDKNLINENTVFQVSTSQGNPCYVGGTSYNNLLEMPSIGSEDFPFISKLYGVKGTAYRLPGGEYSDTSAFANIKVTGYEGQIDIGLFGVVGKFGNDVENETNAAGSITDLLLYNIQIATDALGAVKQEHTDYNALTNHETNHIGILAGHAQNTAIKNISVYYSGTETAAAPGEKDGSSESDVQALLIASSNTAKYTSSGGIIGFYKNIFIGEAKPVSTESFYDKNSTGGGNTIGSGTGIMFSGDLWDILTEGLEEGQIANTYPLQESFGSEEGELYYRSDPGKTYFTRGVFTFAHSFQLSGKDSIIKLWSDASDSSQLAVATSYTGTSTTVASVEKYTYQQITSLYEPISTDYRYLLVYDDGTNEHVLTRGGQGAVAQQLLRDSSYISIPAGQLNFYSAKVVPTNSSHALWSDANTNSSYTQSLFFYFGPYANDDDKANGRPLRTYSDGLAFADTTTATSLATLYLIPGAGTNAGKFILKRPTFNWYVGCSFSDGAFTGFTNVQNDDYYFKIYKVGGGSFSYVYAPDEENQSSEIPCSRVANADELGSSDYIYFITDSNGANILTRSSLTVTSKPLSLGSTSVTNTTVNIPNEQLYNWTATVTKPTPTSSAYRFSYGGFRLEINGDSSIRFAAEGYFSNQTTADHIIIGTSIFRIYNIGNTSRNITNTFGVGTSTTATLRIYKIALSDIKTIYTPSPGGGNGTYGYASGSDTLNCERVTSTGNLSTEGYVYFITNSDGSSILTRNGTAVSAQNLTLGSTTAANTTVNIPYNLFSTWTSIMTTGYYFNYGGYYLSTPANNTINFSAANDTSSRFRLDLGTGGTSTLWRIRNYNNTARVIQDGFSVANTSTYTLRIYRILMPQIKYTPDSSSVVIENDDRTLYTPATGATKYDYDMSKNVLFYTGTDSSTGYYRYNLTSIESLSWADEDLDKITEIDTALGMADASKPRFSSAPFGLTSVTLSNGQTISAAKGSVVFQITGTGTGTTGTANVNIIVATNPKLMVDQTIACHRIVSSESTDFIGSIMLPPPPGQVSTTPILVSDTANGLSDVVAYTNFNTVLVAYTFQINTNFNGVRNYYLASEQGAALFAYFSVDRTAADKARNPDHENELFFSPLNGIDYVHTATGANTEIINVSNSNYVQSLVVPYFGYAPTPTSNQNKNDFTIIPNYNLAFSIRRIWVVSNIYGSNGYGELYITAAGQTASIVNFTECVYTYVNSSGYRVVVYADHVVIVKDDSAPVSLPPSGP